MSKTNNISESKRSKSSERNDKKIQNPKKKSVSFKKEKNRKEEEKTFKDKDQKHTRKNIDKKYKKISNKKHQLKNMDPESNVSSDDEKNASTGNETSDTEIYSDMEYQNDSDANSSTDVEENDDNDDLPETQPLLEKTSMKRKKPSSEKQNTDKAKQAKKSAPTAIFEGWEVNDKVSTKDIDFLQWQAAHPNRETFFIGPDSYIYANASSMKKFVDILRKEQIDENSISIAIKPMSKVIATNPRITIGVTGSRYIRHNGGGYGVSPILYIAKEYVSCTYINFI